MDSGVRLVGLIDLLFAYLTVLVIALIPLSAQAFHMDGKRVGRVDTHQHFIPDFYREFLVQKGVLAGGYPTPPWSASLQLEVMDRLGIETAYVSISSPGVRVSADDDLVSSRQMARRTNMYAFHDLVQKFPGRYEYWAVLTLPDVEGSIAEAEYAFDYLGASGVKVDANALEVYLGDPMFDPLLEVLNDRHATVFVHPNYLPGGPAVVIKGIPPFLADFCLDTTRAALNLVLHNVTIRFPNVKFLLSHAGGFLPFLSYRFAPILPMLQGTIESPESYLQQFQKFYLDTALSSSPAALPSIVQFSPHTHIVYGSDWPYAREDIAKRFNNYLDDFPLSEKQRAQIYRWNAMRLALSKLPKSDISPSNSSLIMNFADACAPISTDSNLGESQSTCSIVGES